MSVSGILFRLNAGRSDRKRDAALKAPESVKAIRGVNYAGNRDVWNMLDVYVPKDAAGPLPVVVSVHGGGYVYGTKEVYQHYGMFWATLGFVFVNFNYHLAPRFKFPTQLGEINAVMEFLCAHGADYGLDLGNVCMVGDSAGAQMLSQYAAILTNPAYAALFPFSVPDGFRLRAIALNCGTYRFDPEEEKRQKNRFTLDLMRDYLGRDYRKFGEMMKVPEHITGDYPPTFVMTAVHDFLKDQAEPMRRFLAEKGVETVYRCYGTPEQKYMGHVCHVNMNLEEAKAINREQSEFFRAHLRRKGEEN